MMFGGLSLWLMRFAWFRLWWWDHWTAKIDAIHKDCQHIEGRCPDCGCDSLITGCKFGDVCSVCLVHKARRERATFLNTAEVTKTDTIRWRNKDSAHQEGE